MSAIERIAAYCRKNNLATRDLRLAECRERGLTGTLKAALPLIEAEIKRQNAIAMNRAKARELKPVESFEQLADKLRDYKRRKARALPARRLPVHKQTCPQATYSVGRFLVTLRREDHSYWKGYQRRVSDIRPFFEIEWIDDRKRVCKIVERCDHHCNGLKSACLALAGWRDKLPAGSVPTPHTDKLSLRIQPIVDLREIEQPNKRLRLYERTLCGESLGFVATYRGENYHGGDAASTIAGVREKAVAARSVKRQAAIGREFGLTGGVRQSLTALGFCREGINDAFSAIGMTAEQLTPETVGSVTVEQLRDVAKKWRRELSTVAAIVLGNERLSDLIAPEVRTYLKGLI